MRGSNLPLVVDPAENVPFDHLWFEEMCSLIINCYNVYFVQYVAPESKWLTIRHGGIFCVSGIDTGEY